MAILSNINGKFAVESTGAIKFNGQVGTSGYILKSNGNSSPTWVDPDTVIGGPYLPLAGGTLTGNLAINGSNSLSVGGALTGSTAGFSGSITASGNSNSFGNTTIAALSASTGTFSASVTAAGNSNSFGITTFTGAVTGTSFSATSGFINGSNGGIRIHSSGTKFFNITAANAARDNIMDIGAPDARFKDLYLGGSITAVGTSILTDTNAFPLKLNRGLDTSVVGTNGVFLGLGSYSSGTTYVDAARIGANLESATSGDLFLQVNNGGTYTNALTINNDTNATFAGLVSGATPIAAANFTTKAYVDTLNPPGGPYLPLAGGTLTGNLTVNARGFFNGGGAYPLQTSSTQRYNFQIRNTNNTVNSGYGWWLATDTNFNFALHADGSGDKFTLTRTGNATFTGEILNAMAAPKIRLQPTTQNNASILELGVLNGGTNAYARIDAINLQNFDTNLRFYTNPAGSTTQTLALTLNSDQSATFAGTIETTTLRTDVINNKANSANIIYRSGTNTIVGGGSGSNKLYVNDDGNVGIGTPDPDHKLEVIGGLAIRNNNSRLYFGSNNGTDRRALEGNTAGTLLQVGESYSNTQIYNDVQVTGVIRPAEGIMMGASSGYQIPVAYSVGNGSSTAGAIKIQLPQAMTNTMMMFKVRVFEYDTFKSFEATICGYNYNPNNTWYNVSAWTDSSANSDRNFTVRLGYDATATRAVAYIGELNEVWSYPQVWVTEWNGGHSNQGANWHYGYQISFETSSFAGITKTIENTQVNSWVRDGTDLYSGAGIYEVKVTGNTGGSSLRLGGGVAPNGVAQIISTSTGVGAETKKLSILNSHFAFDHGSGSYTTFIGLGNHEIDARGTIIGQNMYAQGSTIGITSGGSFVFGASTSEGVYISRPANTTEMNFYTGGQPRITIESGGQVGVNNTSPSATLHLTALASNGVPFKLQGHGSTTVEQMLMYTSKAAATNWYWVVAQANSVNQLIIYGNGDIKNKNNSYGQISDVRLKENIVDAKPKLEDVKKLKVKNFNLIGDDLKQIGLIAQEVEEVFPGLVNEDKEPDIEGGEEGGVYKSVKYSVLVPILIKAIQELEVRVKELENK